MTSERRKPYWPPLVELKDDCSVEKYRERSQQKKKEKKYIQHQERPVGFIKENSLILEKGLASSLVHICIL